MQTRLHSALLTVVCLWFVTSIASAQVTRPYRGTTQSTRNIILRIENRSRTLHIDLDAWSSRNPSDTSAASDEDINLFVRDFDDSVRRLHGRFDRRQSTTADVQDVLNRASRIDAFLRRHNVDATMQNEWSSMRVDLNELANAYRVRWQQSTAAYPPYRNAPSANQSYGPIASRLTGTYRLDISRSDDARIAADRAARDLAPSERTRVLDSLTRRLEAPEQLALDIRGQSVTIASTRAAQITFVADGRNRTEINSRGRTIRSRATVNGGELMVSTTGDTGNDFTVTFDALDNGQRLNVTRRVYVQGLTNPVIVRSFYEKTSEVAQFDIYDPH